MKRERGKEGENKNKNTHTHINLKCTSFNVLFFLPLSTQSTLLVMTCEFMLRVSVNLKEHSVHLIYGHFTLFMEA